MKKYTIFSGFQSKVILLFVLLLFAGLGCGSQGSSNPPQAGIVGYRLIPITIWGTDLDSWQVKINNGKPQQGKATDSIPLVCSDGQTLQVQVMSNDNFIPATLKIICGNPPTVSVKDGNARYAIAFKNHVGYIFVGLDHKWFASTGRPVRKGNSLTFLMDGEDFWGSVYKDLKRAKKEVLISTWWWQSFFELFRPQNHIDLTREQRWQNTIMGVLDTLKGVKRYVLVNWFMGNTMDGLAYVNTDPYLRAKARAANDDFEAMIQANPTNVPLFKPFDVKSAPIDLTDRIIRYNPRYRDMEFLTRQKKCSALSYVDAASYHQKFLVIDHDIAYIAGMNIKSTDWDTHAHRVFEVKRMKFLSSKEDRIKVQQKRIFPDLGPRKDYGMRIQGPAAFDAEDVFVSRWNVARQTNAMFHEFATPLKLASSLPQKAGDLTAQVVATLPAPFFEQSILETNKKAVINATSYIYIEDQYFRAPVLNEAIIESMKKHPNLKLIVITKPVTDSDGGKKYTYLSDKDFRTQFPDRYILLQLKSFDLKVDNYTPQGDELPATGVFFKDIDTHSKIMLVDDKYLSVGSCNKNNRGYLYEGELDVAVLDNNFVKNARDRIIANLLGISVQEASQLTPDDMFNALKQAADNNQAVEDFWEDAGDLANDPDFVTAHKDMIPKGFVYPLHITSTYLMDVGPDAF